jgi:predicted kinase
MGNHLPLPPGRVLILAGVPGSGKSTYVNNLGLTRESVVSADNYFVGSDGEYRFDPTKLGAAHGDCLRGFVAALHQGMATVVVDNTNTTVIEMAPYVALAAAYGYAVEIVRFACDPAVAAARNVHGVPERACRAMAERLERTFQEGLPPFWNVTVTTRSEP